MGSPPPEEVQDLPHAAGVAHILENNRSEFRKTINVRFVGIVGIFDHYHGGWRIVQLNVVNAEERQAVFEGNQLDHQFR
jgi:hypothetical protein